MKHFMRAVVRRCALDRGGRLRPAQATPPLPAGVTRGQTVEGITEYRLANGLRFILFPDPSKPTATVNITYLVGSRHENYGETGMAHLLEHLIFKGSKNHPNPDAEFNKRGFQNNGSTWLDRTNYFSTFQASDDNLKWAIDWSADAMVNSFIAKKDLDSEMTVVRNEFEMGKNNPSRMMFERNQAMLYDWHNYGKSADRRALRHRERAHREPAGVLSHVLPARQRGADRRRQVRRSQGDALDRRRVRQASRSRSGRCRCSGPSSRRTTASASSRSAARAKSSS